ncbi:MAG: UTP--glucose-1-phosphate uridylyltransferase [Ilumatobacter sp.]|nr:UTP--glucose-1-phosphate uridylyltransferase [Ilumatobacter sp.]
MRVRTAVIPCAGQGTRFRPITRTVPKELLPIIATPALQLVLDECVGAGIDHVVLVSSHDKPAIERFGKDAEQEMAGLKVSIAFQDEPRGLGHAVGCARQAVGDEPFAVLLPDELMSGSQLLSQMIDVCERTGGSVVGLKRVPMHEVDAYGVIAPAGDLDAAGVVAISTMVEKPPVADAPSDLIIIGRYVLTNDVFDLIERLPPGAKGEIQLTDALRQQAESGPFHGVLSRIGRHDTGNPLGWLTAVVDLAIDDPTVGPEFTAWLRGRLG